MNTDLGTSGAGEAVATMGSIVAFPDRGAVSWEPWLTEETLARHYDVSERTIRRWRRRGMPSRMFGGARRYRLSECEGWHEQRRSP